MKRRSEYRILLRDNILGHGQWVENFQGEQKSYTFPNRTDVHTFAAKLESEGWKLASIETKPEFRTCPEEAPVETWIFRRPLAEST